MFLHDNISPTLARKGANYLSSIFKFGVKSVMNYPHNGFIDRDDYLDFVDKCRKDLDNSFKEPEPTWWVQDDPEFRKYIEELLLNSSITLSKLKDEYATKLNQIDLTDPLARAAVEVFVELYYRPQIFRLEKSCSYCRRVLYIPGDTADPDRITDADIEAARAVPIETFMGEQGRMSGQKMFFRCPFHEERSASFCVFKDGGYTCFGCGKQGTTIDFVMEKEKLNFVEAVKFLTHRK